MGDKIDKLPTDDAALASNSDLEMIGALFQNKEQVNKVANQFKDPFIGGLLFVALSSGIFDRVVRSSGCVNNIYITVIKVLCFVILFYILKNRF